MNWIETTQGIITLITGACALIGTITGLAIKLYSAFKKIKEDKNWKKIIELADAAITEAEKSGKEGKDKKAQVIAVVEAACKELEIQCDLTALSEYIDKCIAFVNNFIKK